jgi:hypothetical protein
VGEIGGRGFQLLRGSSSVCSKTGEWDQQHRTTEIDGRMNIQSEILGRKNVTEQKLR